VEESATITYQIPGDVTTRVLCRRVLLRPRFLQSVGALIVLSVVAVAVGLALGNGVQYAGYLGLIYAASKPLVMRRIIARLVRNHGQFTDEKTVTFAPSGISAAGPDWKTELPWSRFRGWSEDDRYFYLLIADNGLASLLPKSAMTPEQQGLLRTCLAGVPVK
jgi:hypothetical protein